MNSLIIAAPTALATLGALGYGAAHPRAQLFGRTICGDRFTAQAGDYV